MVPRIVQSFEDRGVSNIDPSSIWCSECSRSAISCKAEPNIDWATTTTDGSSGSLGLSILPSHRRGRTMAVRWPAGYRTIVFWFKSKGVTQFRSAATGFRQFVWYELFFWVSEVGSELRGQRRWPQSLVTTANPDLGYQGTWAGYPGNSSSLMELNLFWFDKIMSSVRYTG